MNISFRSTAGLVQLVGLWFLPAAVNAEDWPAWRGPRGDGNSSETTAPTRWDGTAGTNVAWKVALRGSGVGSPIVWQDRLFIISCDEEAEERLLHCLDPATGETRWERIVFRGPLETLHRLNSRASSTPATDGESVFTTFLQVDGRLIPAPNVGSPRDMTPGRILAASYDMDGNLRWTSSPGEFISAHGFCSNPVIYEDLVILNGDHDGESYLVALDRENGEVRWKVPRAHKIRSYVTPLLRTIDGRDQLVLGGSMHVASYDPRTGKQHWKIEGPTEQFVASMVFDGDLFFLTAGFPDYHILAIRPDGHGDVTDTHIAWRTQRGASYVPSPIVVGKYFVIVSDKGIASCFDSPTGNRLWMERLGGGHSASLVAAGGNVYFLSDDGVMTVVRPGAQLEVVAKSPLGERCSASPAIAGGRLFLRGEKTLFAIANAENADGQGD